MQITAESVKELRIKTGVGMMDCKKALSEAGGDFEAAVKLLRERGLAAASKKAGREANEGRIIIEVNNSKDKGIILEFNCETDFVAGNDQFNEAGSIISKAILSSGITSMDAIESITVEGKPFKNYLSEVILKLGENISVKTFDVFETKGFLSSYTHMNGKIGVLIEFTTSIDSELGKDISMHVAAASPQYLKREEVPSTELDAEKDILRNQLKNEGKPDNIVEKIIEGKIGKFYKDICLIEQDFIKDPSQTIKQVLPSEVNISKFRRYSLS